jgi:hypothetical protein
MSDTPIEDGGGNFGRFSRAGVMDEYIERLLHVSVSGIAGGDWIDFFTIFTESSTRKKITDELRRMALAVAVTAPPNTSAARTVALVRELLAAVEAVDPDEDDDESTDADAARLAIAAIRDDLEQVVRAGARIGVEAKELRKLAGLTPNALTKILDADDQVAGDADGAPDGPEAGGVPGPAAGDLAG